MTNAASDSRDKARSISSRARRSFGAIVKCAEAEGHRRGPLAANGARASLPRPVRRGEWRHVAFRIIDKAGNMISQHTFRRWCNPAGLSRDRLLPRQPRADCSGSRGHPRLGAGKRSSRHPRSHDHGLRDGEAVIWPGDSPGGDQQDQWTTQSLRLSMPNSICRRRSNAPAWHSAFSDIVLAAHRAARRACGRERVAEGKRWMR